MTFPTPDVYLVKVLDEMAFAVIRHSDQYRIGTYPSAEWAHRVAKGLDKDARRAWVKAQRKAR
jgi:hypothetical protein